MGHTLGFGEHAQKVLSQNLANVTFTIAALQQLVGDVRQHGHVLCALRHIVGAIKVRANPDVIDAGDFGDVIDVIDQL